MLQEMCQWRRDADIYNLGSKGRMGMWQIIYLESEDFFDRWQSWLELISEQNRLLRNRGACVDTVFRHVSRKVIFMKGRWPIWKESKDVHGWNRPMEFADGPGEYALKMLICPLWCSADGELPMKSREEKRIRTLRESWWFGCNILSSLSLVSLFFRV